MPRPKSSMTFAKCLEPSPSLIIYLSGIATGFILALLIYVLLMLLSINKTKKIIEANQNNITEEDVRIMITKAQDNYKFLRKSEIKEIKENAYKESVLTLVNGIASKCFPDSKKPLQELSIDESIFAMECFYKLLLEFQKKHKTFDIRVRHIWLVDQFFKKTMNEEVCENKKFNQRKNKLLRILQSESVICLLQDKVVMPKGLKRKIWDYLALEKHWLFLTMYTYFYKYD